MSSEASSAISRLESLTRLFTITLLLTSLICTGRLLAGQCDAHDVQLAVAGAFWYFRLRGQGLWSFGIGSAFAHWPHGQCLHPHVRQYVTLRQPATLKTHVPARARTRTHIGRTRRHASTDARTHRARDGAGDRGRDAGARDTGGASRASLSWNRAGPGSGRRAAARSRDWPAGRPFGKQKLHRDTQCHRMTRLILFSTPYRFDIKPRPRGK